MLKEYFRLSEQWKDTLPKADRLLDPIVRRAMELPDQDLEAVLPFLPSGFHRTELRAFASSGAELMRKAKSILLREGTHANLVVGLRKDGGMNTVVLDGEPKEQWAAIRDADGSEDRPCVDRTYL